MKYLSMLRRVRPVLATLVLLGIAFIATGVWWHSSAVRPDKNAENKQRLHSRIRKGVGTEVEFATTNSSPGNIRASVNSVDNFIFKRSGVKLSGPTKNRLAAMEEHVLNGAGRRLTIAELSQIITAVGLERASILTDQEIAHMDKSLRGFDAPGLPDGFRRGHERFITPRVGSLRKMSSEQFITQMKSLRDQISTPTGEVLRGVTGSAVYQEMHGRASSFSEAVPEKFGGMWNVSNDTEGVGLTPLQAVLLAYSVASEDLLCDSEVTIGKYMNAVQVSRSGAQEYPSPNGHFAYGTNGYIYSSPIDLVFDEQTVNRFLDRIEERSAQ